MSARPSAISSVSKILIISLSNIGDVILTFPVIDVLREDLPGALLDVVVGPKPVALFKDNLHIHKVIVFNKHQPLREKARWLWRLKQERYDMVVDLRNTAIPFFLGARRKTPLRWTGRGRRHRKHEHLDRLRRVHDFCCEPETNYALSFDPREERYVSEMIDEHIGRQRFVAVGPGAADHAKRWASAGFARVCDVLRQEYGLGIVFVGDASDSAFIGEIREAMNSPAADCSGKTSLTQLACLIRRASLVLSNDSAIMHMASYLDVPVAALFGPTPAALYGPWGSQSCVIKKTDECPACREKSGGQRHTCMDAIQPDDVLTALKINFPQILSES